LGALTAKLKALRLGDVAIRRNPLYYAGARRELRALDDAGLAGRRDWARKRLGEVLWCARRTGYGRRVGGTGELAAWPLLDKSAVRA
jgi:phenylacetate-CoA ligase